MRKSFGLHNLIDSDDNKYLTVDCLIEMVTGSNNITQRRVNVKQYGFNKKVYGLRFNRR